MDALMQDHDIKQFLSLPGYRASTYDTDKPLLNIIETFTDKFIHVDSRGIPIINDHLQHITSIFAFFHGAISTSIINFVRPRFHPEIPLWYVKLLWIGIIRIHGISITEIIMEKYSRNIENLLRQMSDSIKEIYSNIVVGQHYRQ